MRFENPTTGIAKWNNIEHVPNFPSFFKMDKCSKFGKVKT